MRATPVHLALLVLLGSSPAGAQQPSDAATISAANPAGPPLPLRNRVNSVLPSWLRTRPRGPVRPPPPPSLPRPPPPPPRGRRERRGRGRPAGNGKKALLP